MLVATRGDSVPRTPPGFPPWTHRGLGGDPPDPPQGAKIKVYLHLLAGRDHGRSPRCRLAGVRVNPSRVLTSAPRRALTCAHVCSPSHPCALRGA